MYVRSNWSPKTNKSFILSVIGSITHAYWTSVKVLHISNFFVILFGKTIENQYCSVFVMLTFASSPLRIEVADLIDKTLEDKIFHGQWVSGK